MKRAAKNEGKNKVKSNFNALNRILDGSHIIPVYQPIVSLKDGRIFGYEALTRISDKTVEFNTEQMFRIADKMNKLWELETLCRKKALKNAKFMNADNKLFLNVNPNIIHDAEFINGFTKGRLTKYGLDFLDIVFEITERNAVIDKEAFLKSIDHYREQNFKIAIDDVGSGYSGLNAIYDIRPDIMKLDMSLTRNIDKDEIKQHLCKAMVEFGKNAGIMVIAEGIETREELKTLIKINAEFGQGYFLGIPQENFIDISADKKKLIKNYQRKMERKLPIIIEET